MADTYLKLHDGFPENRKVVAAGGDAAWLHVCALAYASRNLTDGRVPVGVVSRLSDRKQPARLASKLVDVGLWHKAGHDCARCPQPSPDEYVIHDYLIHQRSAAKVEEIKAKRADAGRNGGTQKAANARTGATRKPKQTPSNLLDGWQESVEANGTPYTDTEEPLRGSQTETDVPPPAGADAPRDVDATAGTIIAEWLDRCQKRPPGQVIGQVGKHIKAMLAEGIDPDDIRRGVAHWMTRRIAASQLPGVVNDVMNVPVIGPGAQTTPRPSTTDQRVGQAIELSQRLAARENQAKEIPA